MAGPELNTQADEEEKTEEVQDNIPQADADDLDWGKAIETSEHAK